MSVWELCREGNLKGVKAAIDGGQDLNSSNANNSTGLMWALTRGHNSVVELLLSQPSLDVNTSDISGDTALHCAYSNVTGLKLLLQASRLTSINARDRHGYTPLMMAVCHGSAEVVQELVRVVGVDLETRDDYGRSLEELAMATTGSR